MVTIKIFLNFIYKDFSESSLVLGFVPSHPQCQQLQPAVPQAELINEILLSSGTNQKVLMLD